MPNSSPYFSIVTPTFNRGHLIAKTIESILAQENGNFELIIVDDGSTDNTSDIVRQYADNRIFYHYKDNGERGAARNFGLNISRGKYVNFFDSDDLMLPGHLSVAFDFVNAHNSPEFFHLGYNFQSPEGQVLRRVDNFDESLLGRVLFDNVLSCNGVFLRTDIALQNRFQEDRKLASAEDWELWIRLLAKYRLLFSNAVTSSIVMHDQRSIFTIRPEKILEREEILIRSLKADPHVLKLYGRGISRFSAERLTFIMLSMAEHGRKKDVLKWAFRALTEYPLIILSKRFLAPLKKIIV